MCSTALFVESHIFTKFVSDYLDDEQYSALQHHMLEHPKAGKVIRGSGGVRKLRWSVSGKGKAAVSELFTMFRTVIPSGC